ncbi:hypothetical protein EPN83_01900 [Patescibacteria group bacterium]|nr:MAG: hypothetical protein EPN83_01900 [Patescibacteria group bacterium]
MGLLQLSRSHRLPLGLVMGVSKPLSPHTEHPKPPPKIPSVRARVRWKGGVGGNSAAPEQKIEASPAACSVRSRSQQKSFLFLLPARRSLGAGGEEKIRRAQIRKSKENFFAGWRASARGGGAASFIGGLPEMGSDFVQGMEPNWMIRTHFLKMRVFARPAPPQAGLGSLSRRLRRRSGGK